MRWSIVSLNVIVVTAFNVDSVLSNDLIGFTTGLGDDFVCVDAAVENDTTHEWQAGTTEVDSVLSVDEGFLFFFSDKLYFLCIAYVLCQRPFRAFCARSNVYEANKTACKRVMGGYNVVMAVFSLWSALYMSYVLVFEVPDGVYGLGHFESERYAYAVRLFYLSKYLEFLDTYFLILCNRRVIWLQYLHHMIAPLDMGLLYHHKVEGAWIYVVFNGFIHTIMYWYYACCIMKWRFPWKRVITTLQLIQFFAGLTVMLPYIWIAAYWADPAKRFTWLFNYAYVCMNVTLFANFFYRTYVVGA